MAVFYQERIVAFHQETKRGRSYRQIRYEPVHEDEHEGSRKRGDEWSSAGNAPTGQRANHNYEDSIKGSRLPEEPFFPMRTNRMSTK